MRKLAISLLALTAMTAGALAPSVAAFAADPTVKAGVLTCNVASGWGFVFGSSRSLKCSYEPKPGVAEHYVGRIAKFGVDIGYLSNAVIIWGVVAPSADATPGMLSGDYAGATASASIAIGLGANVLVGGSTHSIALQPVSIEGNQGLNVAAGIAALHLRPAP